MKTLFLVMFCILAIGARPALGDEISSLYQGSLPRLNDFSTFELKELRGTPSLWYFFQKDCASCLKQAQDLTCLPNTIPVLAMGLWSAPEVLRKEFRKHRNQASGFYITTDLSKKLGILQTPTLFFVDKEGRLYKKEVHRLSCDMIKRYFEKMATGT